MKKPLSKRQFVEATMEALEWNPRFQGVRITLDDKPITLDDIDTLEDLDLDRILFLDVRHRGEYD